MRKAFTILELLVASLLLGMLMTILTMIFSQSSIAWRTGTAIVADLDDVRTNIAELREEADNAYIWDNKIHRLLGLWDDNGNLRHRAWDIGTEASDMANQAAYLKSRVGVSVTDNTDIRDFTVQADVSATGNFKKLNTYKINVKSAGTNKRFGDYDDIWSDPDDFID